MQPEPAVVTLPHPISATVIGDVDHCASAKVRKGQHVSIVGVYSGSQACKVKAGQVTDRLGLCHLKLDDEDEKELLDRAWKKAKQRTITA